MAKISLKIIGLEQRKWEIYTIDGQKVATERIDSQTVLLDGEKRFYQIICYGRLDKVLFKKIFYVDKNEVCLNFLEEPKRRRKLVTFRLLDAKYENLVIKKGEIRLWNI